MDQNTPPSRADDGERAAKRFKMDAPPAPPSDDIVLSDVANLQEPNPAIQASKSDISLSTDTAPTSAMSVENGTEAISSDVSSKNTDVKLRTIDGGGVETPQTQNGAHTSSNQTRRDGVAKIKPEYLITSKDVHNQQSDNVVDDDAAEGRVDSRGRENSRDGKQFRNKKQGGQNIKRHHGQFDESEKLCPSRTVYDEFSPRACRFGDRCKLSHDLRKYLDNKREDLKTFEGRCVVFEKHGRCPSGWKCRWIKSHMKEIEREDGKKELVLVDLTKVTAEVPAAQKMQANEADGFTKKILGDVAMEPRTSAEIQDSSVPRNDVESRDIDGEKGGNVPGAGNPDAEETLDRDVAESTVTPTNGSRTTVEGKSDDDHEDKRPGIHNTVTTQAKIDLNRRRTDFQQAETYIQWMTQEARLNDERESRRKKQSTTGIEDIRAQYTEPPFKPSEKRQLYFGPETPVLAPLTTQGNVPFRRLCVELGCQLTYSEMAMGAPIVQGSKSDWALMKAHDAEISPPTVNYERANTVLGYDNSKDQKFGAQIESSQLWSAVKTANILARYTPKLRVIDLNCGCPIDMVFKAGGGSGLLDHGSKLERMIRGMNAVSGEIPITAKIRTGVKTNQPTAGQLIGRLCFGGRETRDRLGAPGCAAITLHGRSREQRYTKVANWEYIAECATMIKNYNIQRAKLADTAAEPDASSLPNNKDSRMFFIGNGDCYSHVEYFDHIEKAKVDSVMIGRGALVKPWLFEEIEKGQYLDKSSSERLTYIEKFVRYGLEAWGSDEMGVNFTRRFLLEWLSFTCRYVPIGLLERLPPGLNDRPPPYRGRDDLETLMASPNYKDWIKISEMFLGPAPEGFNFQPKHKSNAYDTEG